MLSILSKFKEVTFSIIPIFIVIMVLSFTLTPLSTHIIAKFIIGTILAVLGMPIFLLGVDISISSIGEQISEVLVKSNKLLIILLGGCFFGFIVTFAEPDLNILATQVSSLTNGQFNSKLMILIVSIGIGIMVSFGIFRILKNIRLNRFMLVVYMAILALGFFTKPDFLAIAFDASGSTTGSISVPFILAIAVSISGMTRSHEKEENDGFGMLGIVSAGAIIAVMIQGIFTSTGTSLGGNLPEPQAITGGVLYEIVMSIPQCALETLSVILPILIIYLIINLIWIKASKHILKRIFVGSIYTYIGLVLFLTGVNSGFIETSRQVGYQIASLEKPWLLILVGMLFGIVTIPAEPAIHILTRQIEDETTGSIKSFSVMITLCLGVAVAVGLSMLRIIIPQLELWHILLSGMLIVIILSFIVPDIFVGIAYDSGGASAGTMTAAFILPFAQGAAEFIPHANVLEDGFGLIALVAMTPLIALQLLGFIYKIKSRRLMLEINQTYENLEDTQNEQWPTV